MAARTVLVLVFAAFTFASSSARAEDCRCLSVAGELTGAIQAEVAIADGLYARADYAASLAIYAKAYASTRAPALLYAQAMAQLQLGAKAEAKALFAAYLAAGGTLAFKGRAEAAVRDLGGVVGKTGGAVTGTLGRLPVVGGAAGAVGGGAVGTVTGVAGIAEKPAKVAGGAAMVLGIVAVAALGAVGIHAIAAGLKDDISLDAKFDLGLGLTGAVVGITAIYVGGLTVATGAAGGVRCVSLPKGRPLVAPVAMPGGGGVVTAFAF